MVAAIPPCRGYGDTPRQQGLHFLELCAGSHHLTDVALEFGLQAHAMDASWS